MKPTIENHQDYKSRVRSLLREHYPDGFYWSLSQKTWLIYNRLLSTNLGFIDSMIMGHYSSSEIPPRQPSCKLRSLILSIEAGCASLVVWASLLKSSPFCAILSGFHPGDTPGASTFHDFFGYLWLSDEDNISPHVRQPHPKVVPPEKKGEKTEPVGGITAESLFQSYKEHPFPTGRLSQP